MGDPSKGEMSVEALLPYLKHLRTYTPNATISGGEPYYYKQLHHLTSALVLHDFDITLVTSKTSLPADHRALYDISALHLSLHPSIGRRDESTALKDMRHDVERLRHAHPILRLTVNIVHGGAPVDPSLFDQMVALMRATHCEIKFVSLFTPPNLGCLSAGAPWEVRWTALLDLLARHQYTPIASSPRDVRFEGNDGTNVALSDIGCISQDARYANGHCFDTMDIVVTPSLEVQLCRWPGKGMHLSKLAGPHRDLTSSLAQLMSIDAKCCPFKTPQHPLATSAPHLAHFAFQPHYRWPDIPKAAVSRAARVLRCNEISYGGANGVSARLEREFGRYIGASYALSTASGTLALYLAYYVLGFRDGAEVVVPVYSYPGTITPLVHLGAKVRFCDVDSTTGNIDPASLARVISPGTKGVVLTHMWGCPAPVQSALDICRKHGLLLVEDCSHAAGATVQGQKVGTFGDIACFSLQANKTIAAGEGGMLVTSDRRFYEQAIVASTLRGRILDSVHGRDREFWETGTGLKMRIHPVGAAIALEHLRNLNETNKARAVAAMKMDTLIGNIPELLPPKRDGVAAGRVYYTYKATLSSASRGYRDDVVGMLIRAGCRMARSDLRPLINTRLFGTTNIVDATPDNFLGATTYYQSIISLPVLYNVPDALLAYYSEAIRSSLAEVYRDSNGVNQLCASIKR